MLRKLLYRILKSLPYSVIITVYLFKILNRLNETRKKKSGLVRVYIQPYNGHERICWILGDDSIKLSNLLTRLAKGGDWMVIHPQRIAKGLQCKVFDGVYPICYAYNDSNILGKMRRAALIYDSFDSAKEGYREIMTILRRTNPDIVKHNNIQAITHGYGSLTAVSTPRNGTFVSQILK